jgi:hypothetical protein
MEEGFLFGIRLDRFGYKDQLLIAVTEKRMKEEMDWLVERLRYKVYPSLSLLSLLLTPCFLTFLLAPSPAPS